MSRRLFLSLSFHSLQKLRCFTLTHDDSRREEQNKKKKKEKEAKATAAVPAQLGPLLANLAGAVECKICSSLSTDVVVASGCGCVLCSACVSKHERYMLAGGSLQGCIVCPGGGGGVDGSSSSGSSGGSDDSGKIKPPSSTLKSLISAVSAAREQLKARRPSRSASARRLKLSRCRGCLVSYNLEAVAEGGAATAAAGEAAAAAAAAGAAAAGAAELLSITHALRRCETCLAPSCDRCLDVKGVAAPSAAAPSSTCAYVSSLLQRHVCVTHLLTFASPATVSAGRAAACGVAALASPPAPTRTARSSSAETALLSRRASSATAQSA